MAEMIKMEDYRSKDGNIDWSSYYKAQTDAGEKCYECGKYIFNMFKRDYIARREKCKECNLLETNSDEVNHHSFIRCPKCRATMNIHNFESYELHNDGEHEIMCQECEHEFEIRTDIEYSFSSPELIKPKK
jgi:uncharacterized protein YlaI